MNHSRKAWIITGASSGIGRALAGAAIARGGQVAIIARRGDRLQEIARGCEADVLPLQADITDPAAREQAVAAALARFGRIDVLANIAGRGVVGAAEEFSLQQLRQQMELNFFAAAEMSRAVLPQMRAQGSGQLLSLTSIAGLVAMNAAGPYCAAKFALEGWTESLALEVAPAGIRVTLVEPGAFRTEFAGDTNMPVSLPAARIAMAKASLAQPTRQGAGKLERIATMAAGAPRYRRVKGSRHSPQNATWIRSPTYSRCCGPAARSMLDSMRPAPGRSTSRPMTASSSPRYWRAVAGGWPRDKTAPSGWKKAIASC